MYSYPHHIGDFIKDTARLTDAQAMTYLRMIWMYYDTETPLPDDSKRLAFMLGACPEDTQLILEHYFSKDGAVYRHKRCDAEIEAYRNRQEHGRRAAKSRWENAQSMQAASSGNARSTKKHANREPITDNREPVLKNTGAVAPVDVDPKLWSDFLQIRKAKRSPLTATALEAIKREADKAGWTLSQALTECVTRGWQGFKADWVSKQQAADKPQKFDPFEFVNKGRKDNVVIDITPTA